MRARQTIVGAAIAMFAVGCNSGVATAPPPLPPDALPGAAGDAVRLDTAVIAGDAVDPEQLKGVLEDAGFEGGTQRAFSQTEGMRRQRSVARVLGFVDAQGAETYLGWLRDHVDEVIGTAELQDPPDLPGVAFLAHSDPDCCPKASPVYLVAWRHGSTVLTLEVGGDGIDETTVADLAATLDGSVPA